MAILFSAFPNDWCLENVAKLLKLSGHSIAVEILGSKAVNGRIHELAYIGYYLVQVSAMTIKF